MVKFLMLITSLAGGGAERVASELSLNLSPNIQRRIITLTNKISYPSNMPPLSMNFNFKKRNLLDRLMKYIYSIIVGSIKYRKIINEYKPEVSLSFLFFDNFINILSNIGNKKTKIVVSVHIALSMKKSIIDHFVNFLIKILYNKADLVIAVSRGVRDELIRDFNIDPKKIRLMYNPINVKQIRLLGREKVNDEWFNDDLPILMNVGRLVEQKGQWHLIRAFSKVRRKKECKLVIRGDGKLKSYLEGLVRNLNLTKDVKFLKWQKNPFKYISKASVFISSSLWEALPYSLIEAMACGCPIIATHCKYGPSEILGDGKFGILTPPLDGKFYKASDPLTPEEEYLANEIIRLLEVEILRERYSEKGKKRVMDFDGTITIKNYDKMIQE